MFCLLSCQTKTTDKEEVKAPVEVDLRAVADSLAHKWIITDGHVDLPYRLKEINYSIETGDINLPVSSEEGDFDFERARKGGLDAPFMSIYVPSSYQVSGGAKKLADSLIDMMDGIINAHPDKFGRGGSPSEIDNNFSNGLISLPMGMENGAPIEDDINNVQYFYDRGIRYITLTHATDNLICDSSYDPKGTHNGLSNFGSEVVKEMNRVGIMVDISHVSDSTFYQVLDLVKAPVIASHSSLRHYTPSFVRNMSDEMLVKLKENGGVIQIAFGTAFLDEELSSKNDSNQSKLSEILLEKGLTAADPKAKEIVEEFRKNNPILYSDVEKVVDHIDRVVEIAGIDHVGFGSDFDGVGDSLPTGLKDVSEFPNLILALLERGYSAEDIEKICYKNVWRVWNKVEEVAASM